MYYRRYWGVLFKYSMDKKSEEFGSLIFSEDNYGVIWISKERNKDSSKINFGTFIGKIVNDLENIRLGIHIKNDIAIFQGMLNLGLRHGYGTGYYFDGGLYEGDWINNARDGHGIMYYSNGNVYSGNWKNNRKEGIGVFYFLKGCIYKVEIKNNIIDGFGEFKFGFGSHTRAFFGCFRIHLFWWLTIKYLYY